MCTGSGPGAVTPRQPPLSGKKYKSSGNPSIFFATPVSFLCIVNKDKANKQPKDMKTFKVPTREEVSPANQVLFDNLTKSIGKVPNLYAEMAVSSHALGAYLAFNTARTSLRPKEKEAINLVVSEVNKCEYCSSAHTALAKLNGYTDEQILQLRGGSAPFDAKLDALVKYAKRAVETRGHVSGEVLDAFFAAGWTEENLIDTILVIADKTFTNYLHAATKIPVDFPAIPRLTAEVA